MSDLNMAVLKVAKALAQIADAGLDTRFIANRVYWSDQPGYSTTVAFGTPGNGNDLNWRDSPHGGSIAGYDGDDILMGSSGPDSFFGGTGSNTVAYVNSPTGVGACLDPHIHLSFSNNGAAGDTFFQIQNLVGSKYDDHLIGDAGNNQLYGYLGHDILEGGDGIDKLYGGDGDDILFAGKVFGTDTASPVSAGYYEELHGGEGKDRLYAGINADILDGGGNVAGAGDIVDYTKSAKAVTVNLATGHGSGGYAAGDSYTGIEDIVGSFHSDRLIGDANSNVIEGVFGNDTLTGGGGSDVFRYFPWDIGTNTVDYGNDVITDFHATGSEQDRIEFVAAPANLSEHLQVTQHGADTVITGDFFTGSITLLNVNATDVHF